MFQAYHFPQQQQQVVYNANNSYYSPTQQYLQPNGFVSTNNYPLYNNANSNSVTNTNENHKNTEYCLTSNNFTTFNNNIETLDMTNSSNNYSNIDSFQLEIDHNNNNTIEQPRVESCLL